MLALESSKDDSVCRALAAKRAQGNAQIPIPACGLTAGWISKLEPVAKMSQIMGSIYRLHLHRQLSIMPALAWNCLPSWHSIASNPERRSMAPFSGWLSYILVTSAGFFLPFYQAVERHSDLSALVGVDGCALWLWLNIFSISLVQSD